MLDLYCNACHKRSAVSYQADMNGCHMVLTRKCSHCDRIFRITINPKFGTRE